MGLFDTFQLRDQAVRHIRLLSHNSFFFARDLVFVYVSLMLQNRFVTYGFHQRHEIFVLHINVMLDVSFSINFQFGLRKFNLIDFGCFVYVLRMQIIFVHTLCCNLKSASVNLNIMNSLRVVCEAEIQYIICPVQLQQILLKERSNGKIEQGLPQCLLWRVVSGSIQSVFHFVEDKVT